MADKRGAEGSGGTAVPEGLIHGFQDLGLSPYEARVLLALLRRGACNSVELARLSGVPRTAVYPVLHGLGSKGLVERVDGPGPAVWASLRRGDVILRLEAAEEERLRRHRERAHEVRGLLDRSFPETPPEVPLPFVHLLGEGQARVRLEQVLGVADAELLLFTRASSPWASSDLGQVFDDALSRGVRMRMLYEADEWSDPAAEDFRAEMTRYHRAGAEARTVDELPAQMVLVDRRVTLACLLPEVGEGYTASLHVEHSGFAGVAAVAFDQYWSAGRAPRVVVRSRVRTREPAVRPSLRSAG